ncbi:MAG TPA: glucan biosynthesis protein, partial [Xanthomonadaceae bacterium]|nr:glucan biosynthesis protein [Xanthomonadaceae bacterium]
MRRRELIIGGMALPLAGLSGPGMRAMAATGTAGAFGPETVPELARSLARSAYRPPDQTLPAALAAIKYDQYRDYRFRPERALWAGTGLPFQAQFFHRGFLHKDRVDIYEVEGGQAAPFVYAPDMFTYGKAPRPRTR